jgi:hypothetical protein
LDVPPSGEEIDCDMPDVVAIHIAGKGVTAATGRLSGTPITPEYRARFSPAVITTSAVI